MREPGKGGREVSRERDASAGPRALSRSPGSAEGSLPVCTMGEEAGALGHGGGLGREGCRGMSEVNHRREITTSVWPEPVFTTDLPNVSLRAAYSGGVVPQGSTRCETRIGLQRSMIMILTPGRMLIRTKLHGRHSFAE